MNELIYLLDNYWVLRDKEKDWYYKVKNSIPLFKKFITDKLGLNIVVKTDFIKLEKFSEEPEGWMGIQQFDCPEEYIFLMLLIIFLEDKGKNESFLLSELSEFIQINYPENKTIDWTRYQHRRWLVKVLDFCISLGILRIIDGNEKEILDDYNTEILFESNGLSRYVIRNFTEDILRFDSFEDMQNELKTINSTVETFHRRNKVYRKIFFSPIVYNEGREDRDYLYIKNNKSTIEADISKYLECSFHVYRNGALIIVDEEKRFKDTFPSRKSISDLALLINNEIVNCIKDGTYRLNKEDVITLSFSEFVQIVKKASNQYSCEMSTNNKKNNFESLIKDIRQYMVGFNMIRINEDNNICVLPLSGKIIGKYIPKGVDENVSDMENK